MFVGDGRKGSESFSKCEAELKKMAPMLCIFHTQKVSSTKLRQDLKDGKRPADISDVSTTTADIPKEFRADKIK